MVSGWQAIGVQRVHESDWKLRELYDRCSGWNSSVDQTPRWAVDGAVCLFARRTMDLLRSRAWRGQRRSLAHSIFRRRGHEADFESRDRAARIVRRKVPLLP